MDDEKKKKLDTVEIGGFRFSSEFGDITKALLLAQAKFPIPIKNRLNKYYKNRYADFKALLDSVKDYLIESKLLLCFSSNIEGDKLSVSLMLFHPSNQFLCSSVEMTIGLGFRKPETKIEKHVDTKDTDDANKLSGNIIKMCRTLLCLVFLLQAEDEEQSEKVKTVVQTPRKENILIEKLRSLTVGENQKKFKDLDSQCRSQVKALLENSYPDSEIENVVPKWIQFLEKNYGLL